MAYVFRTEADAAALAECRAWVSSLQAFVMEVDMQVAVPFSLCACRY